MEMKGNGTVLEHPTTPSARGTTVPGVDFETVPREVTMEQVLGLLGLQPSTRSAVQWYGGGEARTPSGSTQLIPFRNRRLLQNNFTRTILPSIFIRV